MKTSVILMAMIAAIIMSGCAPIKWTTRDTSTMEVTKSGIYTKPKVADLKIENYKVKGEYEASLKKETILAIKQQALQNALKNANADILVEPIFTIERDGNTVKAEVSGFPAKVTSFKDIDANDTLGFATASKFFVQSYNMKSTSATESAAQVNEQKERKKKVGKAIGLGLGLGLGLPLIIGLGVGYGIQ